MADATPHIALATTSARHLTDAQKVKLQKATREFESIFVEMMLKSMRSAQGEEPNEFGGDSYGGDVMKGMFDTQLSKQIGGQGKFGIAESLYRKLTGESLPGTAGSQIAAAFEANGRSSRKKTAGAAPEAAGAHAADAAQQSNRSADSIKKAARGTRPASTDGMENGAAAQASRTPGSAAEPAATVSGFPGAAASAWTSAAIDGTLSTLPPSPQTTRPERAALSASAGLTSEPARTDAVKTAVEPSGKGANAAFERVKSYNDIIAQAADTAGVDANLLKAMIVQESGGKQNARSTKNAKGLMQLIDSTAKSMGVKNVWDPNQNIQGGAKYLRQLLETFDGDVPLALASYNAGPGNVQRYKGIPPFRETQNYVKRVMNLFTAFQSMERNSDDAIK